jgi:hypothetical protein
MEELLSLTFKINNKLRPEETISNRDISFIA